MTEEEIVIRGRHDPCIVPRAVPVIELSLIHISEAAGAIANGAEVEIDFSTGEIKDLTGGRTYHSRPFPPFIAEIIAAGGLLASIQKGVAAR